jgi:cytochrome P450
MGQAQARTIGETVTEAALEENPYPIYARLREEEPVSFVPSVGLWLVTRFADVEHVDKNPELFTGETEPSTLNRTFGRNLLGSEGPYHDRIRSIVYPAFRAKAIGHYPDEVIAPIVRELVGQFLPRGRAELVSEFAAPLSVRVLKRVLGLTVEDERLVRWFGELALGAANFSGDPERQAIADAASREVEEHVAPILDRLAKEPDDTVLSNMLHSEVDGDRLSRQEILSNLKVMIVGGLQAASDLIGLVLLSLLQHPPELAAVMADPALIDPAIEEAARWHSPVGTSTRQTTREAELSGVKLPKGALVAAVLASANRDPRNYTDPDRFDITRKEGGHLAFATGPHLCIGARLGRYEARTGLRVLFERVSELRLDPDATVRVRGWEFRSPEAIPVLFERREAT